VGPAPLSEHVADLGRYEARARREIAVPIPKRDEAVGGGRVVPPHVGPTAVSGMRDTAVELDHQVELVIQDISVGGAHNSNDPVLPAALWQPMWSFDVPEVSVLQRGMDAGKIRAENGVHVEPPPMPSALVECTT